MEKVDVCPYCGSNKPHQGPTGCESIKWPPEPCIHVGLFAGTPQKYEGVENPTEHCWDCDEDIPITEL